jgi:hypothetical protein
MGLGHAKVTVQRWSNAVANTRAVSALANRRPEVPHSILLRARLRKFCSRYRLTENGDRRQCSRCQSGRMLGSQSMSLKPTRQSQRQAASWTWNERRYRRTSLHKNQNDTTRKLQLKFGFSFYKFHEKKWIFFPFMELEIKSGCIHNDSVLLMLPSCANCTGA